MRIYNIFIGKPQWEAGWPYVGFDNESLIKNTLKRLRKEFPDIDFLGGEMIERYDQKIIDKIKRALKQVDGLIIYVIGQYGDPSPMDAAVELIREGIPTILANYIFGGDTYFIRIYERVKGMKVLPISSIDFEDLEWAINIMYSLYKLRGKKILNYTLDEAKTNPEGIREFFRLETMEASEETLEFLKKIKEFERWDVEKPAEVKPQSYIDLKGVDQAHQWRRDEEAYRRNLNEIFGLEMIRRNPNEIIEEYFRVNEDEAAKLADKWISDAIRISAPRSVIVGEARLYLALMNLMKKYNADVITVDCGTLLLTGFLPAPPCMAMHQLMNEGSKGGPESDMDSLVSSMLCWHITRRPGYPSNHCINLKNNTVIYLHCCAPSRLYGLNGPVQKYEITRHGEGRMVGASVLVDFPLGEKATTIKVSVLKKKIAIRSGEIIGSMNDERACLNKLVVKTNARNILENYDFDTFGWHRVTVVGDWRKEFEAAARLLGLTIVEEDR